MAEAGSRPILGYWPIRAGPRGNINRHVLYYKGVDFEDKRYDMGSQEWPSAKQTLGLDFPNLPYLIDGDLRISESKAVI